MLYFAQGVQVLLTQNVGPLEFSTSLKLLRNVSLKLLHVGAHLMQQGYGLHSSGY